MDLNYPIVFVAGCAENMGDINEFGFEGKDDEATMHLQVVGRFSIRPSSDTDNDR